MIIVLDASLAPRLARALHLLWQPDHEVRHVRDVLGNDASDQNQVDYLSATDGSMLVGMDLDVTGNPHRMAALQSYKRPVFLLSRTWLDLSMDDQGWLLAYWIPRLINKVSATSTPGLYLIPPSTSGRPRKAQ
ncbi:MAG TPA: hypothetical protein PJ991_11110 [Kiritimatiellia bacterium]|nr:hypothetical protein [Kiritimatiellia bacterium]